MTTQYKGAFGGCSWCRGSGCNQCSHERRKHQERIKAQLENPQPIFSADVNDPDDMRLLKNFLGREALEHAFGPDGDGIDEIERNAAVASLCQAIRKQKTEDDE